LGLAIVLTLAPAVRAQKQPQRFAEGMHVLRRILYDLNVKQALESFAQLNDPEHTILIVLGEMNPLVDIPGSLKGFVEKGGAVLLASDQPVRSERVGQDIKNVSGVSLSGRSLFALNARAGFRYRGREDCPFVQPTSDKLATLLFRPPPGRSPKPLAVATNLPSYLQTESYVERVTSLARFPVGCATESRIGLVYFPNWLPSPLFAAGGDVGKGRVLVMSDHSVFINQMMMQTDNGNFDFSYNCLEWLRGEDGQRTKALFVEDGHIQTTFNIPLKEVWPPLDELQRQFVTALDEKLYQFEREDNFNKLLFEGLDAAGITPRDLAKILALLGGLAVLVYGSYRLGVVGRFRPEAGVPALAREVVNQTPAGPLLEQRQQAMFRAGNLWEAAHELARQFFASTAEPALTAKRPPRVESEGGWWHRRAVRRLVRRLWRLARGTAPERVSARQMQRLLPAIDELKADLANGSVRLRTP
jgi:hypothetical protein